MTEFPVFFLSHGAPDLPLTDHPAKKAWQQLATGLPAPAGVIVVSAHWQTQQATVGSGAAHTTIHDFYGFPEQLYTLEYPASGSRQLAQQIMENLSAQGFKAWPDNRRGLDHGAWVPLSILYPQANIPVVPVSLPMGASTSDLIRMGRALAPLRDRNLIICSGAITHNLRELSPEGSPPPEWSVRFSQWAADQLRQGNQQGLENFRNAPYAGMAHPTDEHFLPLFVAFGAAKGQSARLIHDSFSYGSLSMAVFAFGASE